MASKTHAEHILSVLILSRDRGNCDCLAQTFIDQRPARISLACLFTRNHLGLPLAYLKDWYVRSMKCSDESSTLQTRVSRMYLSFFLLYHKLPGRNCERYILLEKGLQLRRHLGVTDMSVEEAARNEWTSGWRKLGEKRLPGSCERGDAERKEGQHLQERCSCRPVAPKSILSRN